MKFCAKCGKEIMDEAVICPSGCRAVEKGSDVMRKLLVFLTSFALLLFFCGCAKTINNDEKDRFVKQQNYFNHSGLSSISNEEVVFNFEDDNSGKVIMNNIVFDFEIEKDSVCLVFDEIRDGLSEYDDTIAKAEKSRLEARRKQMEYDASVLMSNGEKDKAEIKLETAKNDYTYKIVGDYLVNTEEYIDVSVEYLNDVYFDCQGNKGTEEYVFTSNGDFAKKYLTAGTIKSTNYGKYELKNGVIHIDIDRTIREVQGEEIEVDSNITTVGYLQNGKLFYNILVLKK